MSLNQQSLNELFRYEDGKLFWKQKRVGCRPDLSAGSLAGIGYYVINSKDVSGQPELVHRIVWTMINGEIPEGMTIDHIDGDKKNNLIENLRLVTHQDNLRNVKLLRTNTSGQVGVKKSKTAGKFTARIVVDDKEIHLGTFASFDLAVAARKSAESRHGFHPNHGSAR